MSIAENSEKREDVPTGPFLTFLAQLVLALVELAALIAFLTAIFFTALYFTH